MLSYQDLSYNYRSDGPSYRNRAILWFLDNRFMFATSMPAKYEKTPKENSTESYKSGIFPVFIDEVKSVYISENPASASRFLKRANIYDVNVVSIYVYTHGYQRKEIKGLRFTHFDGYYTPQTFVSMIPRFRSKDKGSVAGKGSISKTIEFKLNIIPAAKSRNL